MKIQSTAQWCRSRRRGIAGAVAIEFAIIFPVFFIVFYAIVTYGLIFAAQQTLTLAAAEGGRAAVRWQTTEAGRVQAACDAVGSPLAWLRNMGGLGAGCVTAAPGSASAAGMYAAAAPCSYAPSSRCVSVTVNYDYRNKPLLPQLLGNFLSLPTPATLQGRAEVQIGV